jgi:adenylate cyclase
VPALSLKAVMMARGLEDQPLRRVAGAWRVGDFLIPVDTRGCFPIHPLGQPSSTPYELIYSGAANEGESAKVYHQALHDKIVLIGDTTTMTSDILSTPWGMAPGVEVHAQAIATLLQRKPVQEARPGVNFAVLSLLVAAVCLLTAFGRLPWAALATLGLWGGYIVVNVWLFVDHGVWLHLVAPSIASVLAMLGVLLERSLTVEREKNRMRGLLHRYLSPQTAEYVLAHPEKCHLGGEQVVATVLFSDIRGFTAMAEKLTPTEVVARLNEYFQAMTDIVFRYDSAVDKYMGDALMALFGIPVPHPDHPRRAVAAAIDMQTALRELQAQGQAQGLPLIDIGIGIHTGAMVVGNIGSQERQDFTVIGDAVNLASRVEGLNKELHTRILITASTYEFVQDEVEVRGPLTAHVKGKEEEVIVYEVFGWRDATAETSDAAPAQEAVAVS